MVNVTFVLKKCMACTEVEQYHVARFVLQAHVVYILGMDSIVNATFALKACVVHALRMNSVVNINCMSAM